MTYKKVYRFCDGEIVDGLNRTRYNPKKEDDMQCICTILNALIHEANKSHKENKELKRMLKQQSDGFEFKIIENHVEFNKDELCIKDNNTRIELKNRHLLITVFIPDLNEVKRFHYHVTGKTLMEEYIMLKEEMEQ